MLPNLFYQSNEDNTCPLIFLSKEECASDFANLDSKDKNYLKKQQAKGEYGEICVIYDSAGTPIKVYVGFGNGSDVIAIASAVNRLPIGAYRITATISHRALVAWSLAQYRFDYYKKSSVIERVLFVPVNQLDTVLLESTAVFTVRDLINQPANELHPAAVSDVMIKLAKQHSAQLEQWVGDALLKENFPAIHAVGRAASVEPRLLNLTWGNPKHPRITLVGKGVCFDSGGLDLKSSSTMRLMKKDMGGAAQVIGLAQWIMTAKLPIHLQVLIPTVENALGSRAYRPGDIITMRNGLTVEIDNTDAEGRLILADALVKADEFHPELLIDFATLTGAARVAVGTELSALFSNDDTVSNDLIAMGNRVHDPLWRMPLFEGYAPMLDSSVADLANSTASPYAGAITAALFLQRFVNPKTAWVHFDIMAWNVSSKPGKPEGGEAMAMQAVAHYLFQRYGATLN